MSERVQTIWPTLAGLLAACVTSSAHAQPAPSGAHPRIWLDAATRSKFKAQAGVPNGPVARAAARCAAARNDPAEYATGGWQGFEFVTTLSGCLTAWLAAESPDDLQTAIKYWNVLLDDYQSVGDGQGGDTVVTHDTGYAMRTFAPFSALAYDWLHDAPGVTEAMRSHALARFDAWSTYYSSSGYLRHLPGANYQAGYVFAATLMAIAEAGEAGAAGDAHWANVRDVIWQGDMLPALAPGGVLEGGDWPEGWQYGPLSVLEYSLAARAMQENGAPVTGMSPWASSLPLRFAYGLTPVTHKTYVAGDTDASTAHRDPVNGALLAALAGPASAQAKAWAQKLNADLGLDNENPLFDALAAASDTAGAPLPADAATSYLARGSGNWYVRGSWDTNTAWSVFQCSRHLVDDHQHSDAGNWVLTRGADDLVVDPSPYGSLSTLTGNAPAVDSDVLPAGYSPSQGYWGESTALLWARQTESGIAAARCSYADQFRRSDVPSDVSSAIRDFVLTPDGDGATIVLIDRVMTGAAQRGLHLRVRSPAALALAGDVAKAELGTSSLSISRVFSSSGSPSVRSMPQASECPSSDHTCDVSRLASGSEYRIDVDGPSAYAIHVVDAHGAPVNATSTALAGAGYRGVLVGEGPKSLAVIASDTADGATAGSLVYRAPAGQGSVHVVVDAPVDADGQSDVSAVLEGTDCKVEVQAHQGAGPGVSGRPLVLRTTSDCSTSDDGTQLPTDPNAPGDAAGGSPGLGGVPPQSGQPGTGPTSSGGAAGTLGNGVSSSSRAASSSSCSLGGAHHSQPGSPALLALGAGLVAAKRRRRPALGSCQD